MDFFITVLLILQPGVEILGYFTVRSGLDIRHLGLFYYVWIIVGVPISVYS
jgi:hypothetical protein